MSFGIGNGISGNAIYSSLAFLLWFLYDQHLKHQIYFPEVQNNKLPHNLHLSLFTIFGPNTWSDLAIACTD